MVSFHFPTSTGSNAYLFLLLSPFPMPGIRRWCHSPTSTGSNAHLLLPPPFPMLGRRRRALQLERYHSHRDSASIPN